MSTRSRAAGEPAIERVPKGGIQPQAAVDNLGTIHLIYAAGNPAAADLFYVHRSNSSPDFSVPLKINTEPGSAVALGTIRGAQLALGQNRIHVAWNGHAPNGGSYIDAPMLYTRLNDSGTAFEPERNVITFARGLDGGGSIAADDAGNVFVLWHAPRKGNTNGEAGRAVFVARSKDGGSSFAREVLATSERTGACGCCGMKAFADRGGNLLTLFRAATGQTNRDEVLLAGRPGEELKPVFRAPWQTGMCPMSSASFAGNREGAIFAAWETRDDVFFSRVTSVSGGDPVSPSVAGRRKHPSLAVNSKGEALLAWTESTTWGKGGIIGWQNFDAQLHPIGAVGHAEGLPAWSMPAAVVGSDDRFRIFY